MQQGYSNRKQQRGNDTGASWVPHLQINTPYGTQKMAKGHISLRQHFGKIVCTHLEITMFMQNRATVCHGPPNGPFEGNKTS